MFRASKALLGVLAVDAGVASRQKIGVTPNVLDAIGALLQASSSKHAAGFAKMNEELRLSSEARETPGATESLNDILNQIIADIDSGVEAKILAGVQDTQAAINASMADLSAATATSLDRKASADATDLAWLSCVSEQQEKLRAVETARPALEEAEAKRNEKCQHQQDLDLLSFQPDVSLEFQCSYGSGSCASEMTSFTAQVNGMVSRFEEDAQLAETSWKSAKTACETAQQDVWVKAATKAEAEAGWHSQRLTCQTKHEDRTVGMCLFGDSLQQKCQKIPAHTQLMSEVDQVNGGGHSQPDRDAEWQTVQVTKCMLNKVIAGTELTGGALDECDSSGSQGLPALDRKEAEFSEQTSASNFNCEEQTITFNGETWEIPMNFGYTSDDYRKVQFNPPVNLVDPPAFTFCG